MGYLEKSVDDGDSEVEGLLQEIEAQMDLYQPVDEDSSHAHIDAGLPLKILWLHMELSLQWTQRCGRNW